MAVHFNKLIKRLLKEEVPTEGFLFETLLDTCYLRRGSFRVSKDPRRAGSDDQGVRLTFEGREDRTNGLYQQGWGLHRSSGSLLITGFRKRVCGGPRVFLGEAYD